MNYYIFIILFFVFIIIIIAIIMYLIRSNILARGKLIKNLKFRFHDFEILEDSTNFPELRFSKRGIKIRIYSQTYDRRINRVYDEYLELSGIIYSEINNIIELSQKYLHNKPIIEHEKLTIEIKRENGYDSLIQFIESL